MTILKYFNITFKTFKEHRDEEIGGFHAIIS